MATNVRDFIGKAGAQFAGLVKGTQLQSTVSTGTAPLVVASQTLVSNLNAEFLNGSPSSAFAANPMTTLGDIIYGGASGVQTRLPVGSNSDVLQISSGIPAWVGTSGTGSVARVTSPTFVTPVLGAATATSINKVALTQPATGSTLTIADGKTATVSNTLTFTGTDSSSVAFGAGGTVAYTGNKLSVFAATSSSELAGVISDETGSGLLVFATSPVLTTPNLGTPSAVNLSNGTALPISGINDAIGYIDICSCFDPIFEPPIDFLEECRKRWEAAQSSFCKTIECKIGNTWYVIETECDGNEPLTDKVKRLIFSDKGVIC